jgi:hypothetical protein
MQRGGHVMEFNMRIDQSIIKVEAIFIFMAGKMCDVNCGYCLQAGGPFPFWAVNRQRGARKDCANRWWVYGTYICRYESTLAQRQVH